MFEEKIRKKRSIIHYWGIYTDFTDFLIGNVTVYIQRLKAADNILPNNSSKNLFLEIKNLTSIKI